MKSHPSSSRLCLALLGAGLSGLIPSQLVGQPTQTRLPSPIEPFASYGYSVAVDRNTAVVGAPGELDGAVYIFRRGADHGWEQEARLTPTGPVAAMQFGNAVAISGDTLAVGAHWDGTAGDRAGSVFVFVREGTTWRQQARLMPADLGAVDYFGESVALDGNTLVVGAPLSDAGGGDSGAVYMFNRSGEKWNQVDQLLGPEPRYGNVFGFSVALQSGRLAVGAPYDDENNLSDSGSVIIYENEGSGWRQTATLTLPAAGADANLGWSVGLSGDTVVAGSPFQALQGGAHAFRCESTTWKFEATLIPDNAGPYDYVGYSVAVAGNRIAIGTPSDGAFDEQAGSITLFERTGDTWSQAEKVGSGDVEPFEQLGWAVAASDSSVLVGAPMKGSLDEGAAYVIQTAGNTAPVALPQSQQLPEDSSAGLILEGTDAEGGALAFAVTQPPAHGTLTGTPPSLMYHPNPNFFGPDGFSFTVSDGELVSEAATVALTVTPVNDAPVITQVADLVLPANAGPAILSFTVADLDDEPAALVVGAVASEPTLFPEASLVLEGSGSDRTLTLQPAPGASGDAVVILAVTDGMDTTSTQFAVRVLPPPSQNQPPVARARAFPSTVIAPNGLDGRVALDGSRSSDPEGDALTFRWLVDGNTTPALESAQGNLLLAVGTHTVRLQVSDGLSVAETSVKVAVVTATQAVHQLASDVRRLDLPRGKRTALLAILTAASHSFERQRPDAGVRQLRLFQLLVHARDGKPIDRADAAQLTRAAQRIIDGVTGK